jgi:hypothetical protein
VQHAEHRDCAGNSFEGTSDRIFRWMSHLRRRVLAMSDDPLIIAHIRARQVVGDRVRAKLSERVRIGAVKEGLRALGADSEVVDERKPTPPQTPNRRTPWGNAPACPTPQTWNLFIVVEAGTEWLGQREKTYQRLGLGL